MENCGFLFDAQGDIYPAFYDTKIYQTTYDNLAGIPREVSMVDFRYCMIDAKVYRNWEDWIQNFPAEIRCWISARVQKKQAIVRS